MTKNGTIDAKRALAFRITPRDAKNGKPRDAFDCAAAKALKRKLGAKKVEVRRTRTFVEMPDGRKTRFETPTALKMEIVALDRGGTFTPGEYRLKPIPPSQKPAAVRKRKAQAKAAPKKRGAKQQATVKRVLTPNIRGRA